jgi:hypothetical protein
VNFRCVRTSLVRNTAEENGQAKETYNIVVRAHAIMNRDSHWLVVWEGDEGQKNGNRPVLQVECQDGRVCERVWNQSARSYDENEYSAGARVGASDTTYENGCQIGTLLESWLAGGRSITTVNENLRQAEPLPGLEDAAGEPCQVFRLVRPAEVDADAGWSYEVIQTYYLTRQGHLRQWKTVVINTQGDTQATITQSREYEFKFSADALPLPKPEISTAPVH